MQRAVIVEDPKLARRKLLSTMAPLLPTYRYATWHARMETARGAAALHVLARAEEAALTL